MAELEYIMSTVPDSVVSLASIYLMSKVALTAIDKRCDDDDPAEVSQGERA